MSYLNNNMNFRIFENPSREIFAWGKICAGIVKNPRGEKLYSRDLQIPAGILTFVVEYFLGHRFKAKKLYNFLSVVYSIGNKSL